MTITTQQATLVAQLSTELKAQKTNSQNKTLLVAQWQLENGRLVCQWTQ